MSTLLESRLSPKQRAQACAADAAELAAETAMRNLRAAQAVRVTLNSAGHAIDAALRPCFDRETGTYPGLSGDLRRPYDCDYGSYTGHPMDPRSDADADADADADYAAEMFDQIDCAEQALHMARAALEGHPRNGPVARALMAEARGCLTGAAEDPALLAAMQTLMNGAWPYLTAVQREDAMAAIEAAAGEAL